NGVEPSASARASGNGAVLTTHRMHQIGKCGVLCGKWTLSHTCCVGFHSTYHTVNLVRRYPGTCAGAPCSRVRRCNIRISPMVHVQERSLSAFKENLLAGG